jgi:hypothetical protein
MTSLSGRESGPRATRKPVRSTRACTLVTSAAVSPSRRPPRIAAYVAALLDRYPEDEDAREDGPWADAPLIADASGPYIYAKH